MLNDVRSPYGRSVLPITYSLHTALLPSTLPASPHTTQLHSASPMVPRSYGRGLLAFNHSFSRRSCFTPGMHACMTNGFTRNHA